MNRILLFVLVITLGCASDNSKIAMQDIDVQGHRGARGLYPENSLEGFRAALDMGVKTLELDVCISKDGYPVVSHEPWMNAEICQLHDGSPIPKTKEREYNLFEMSLEAIQKYDCGSLGNKLFPNQKKLKTYKPTLEEVILNADAYAKEKGYPAPQYNIEIKRAKGYDGVFHPEHSFFTLSIMMVIQRLGIEERSIVQSFDVDVMEYLNSTYPEQRNAYLINDKSEIDGSLSLLSFTPDIFSPDFSLLTKKAVSKLHEQNMKVIPWTVNEVEDMKNVIKMGVDGIITDYPDRLVELTKNSAK